MTEERESHIRSILKGLTWRIIASVTTITITYFISGKIETALKVGALEFVGKLALYYFHERAWLLVPPGSVRKVFGVKNK
jgi:uncharacterized membrane protein